jgi:hypothetical protein
VNFQLYIFSFEELSTAAGSSMTRTFGSPPTYQSISLSVNQSHVNKKHMQPFIKNPVTLEATTMDKVLMNTCPQTSIPQKK